MQLTTFNRQLQINSVSFITDFLLTGMVIGPIIAPFLAASGLPILPQIANIIYFMGHHVCPQPHMGVELASPFPHGCLYALLRYGNGFISYSFTVYYG